MADENIPQNITCIIDIENIKVEPIDDDEEEISNVKVEIEIEPELDYYEQTAEANALDSLKTEADVFGKQEQNTKTYDQNWDFGHNSEIDAGVYRKDRLESSEVQKPMFVEVEIKQEPEDNYLDPVCGLPDKDKLYFHPQCEIILPDTSRPAAIHACDICHKKFQARRSLNAHRKIHNFMCDNCGLYFKNKQDIIAHIQNNSENKNSSGNSQQCEKKQFQCDTCHKFFATRSGLNKHSKIHSGNLFACDMCDKQFTEKGNLTCHKRIHTGEKPFQCPVCKRDFTQKSSLNSHVRNHSETKPFACKICNKEFCKKRNLVIHEYIHCEVKPFKCDICDKQFSQVSSIYNIYLIYIV